MNGWRRSIRPSLHMRNLPSKKSDVDRYRFVDKVRTTYRFIRDDGEWYYDINSDGRIDEYERDRKMNWKDLIITRKLSFWKMAGS